MVLTYSDVIALKFGEKEFTAREFAFATDNTRPAKFLSELKMRGLVERVDRGTYRFLRPSERPDLRAVEWSRVKNVIARAPWAYAWAGSTAVEIWSDGRYNVSPNPFLKILHIAVHRADAEKWKKYLESHGVSYRGKKRIGAIVDLIVKSHLVCTKKGEETVIPRKSVIKLIRDHPGLYAGAEDLIGS